LDKYKIPENCQNLQGPKLNPEVQTMLTTMEQNKEGFFLDIQLTLGKEFVGTWYCPDGNA
jgi:hypothetical protein